MTDTGAARKMTRAKLVVLGRDNCGKTGNCEVNVLSVSLPYWGQYFSLFLRVCVVRKVFKI